MWAWLQSCLEAAQAEGVARQAAQAALDARAAQAVAGETVTVKADYKDVTIPLAAIQYIEARNNYACLHLDHQEDVVSQITMKALLEMLPEGKFVRIHRSFIVPVHRIESRKATAVKLVGVDTPLPVGRAHKENLK
jgi:DNA-binding LytR/AlgR family response regulator